MTMRRIIDKGIKLSVMMALGSVVIFLSTACSVSPKNAYALKTAEHGQCRLTKKGERIYYKKKRAVYICEDNHVLFKKPYKIKDAWYFPSGHYDGRKVKKLSASKVEKVLHNRCQLKGIYGTGNQTIKKFYFDTKLNRCQPFEWSGKGGYVPFDSVDICEMECFY